MRNRVFTLAAALLAAAAPLGTRAQESRYEADFPTIRAQFVRNDVRQAAYTLLVAAAHLREEVGRVKDGEVGNRLLTAESKLEALATQIRAGAVSSVGTLDAAFAAADQLLAEHHVRLALWEAANLRQSTASQIGHDVAAAAAYHARAAREAGRTLDPAAQQVVADAQRLAGQLAAMSEPPSRDLISPALSALGRLIAPSLAAGQEAKPH
jgi:hypothetical protein